MSGPHHLEIIPLGGLGEFGMNHMVLRFGKDCMIVDAGMMFPGAEHLGYPKAGPILPAMGYGDAQTRDLEATINRSDVDLVIIGTPIDLSRIIKIKKPSQRVRYELQEIGVPTLEDLLKEKFEK